MVIWRYIYKYRLESVSFLVGAVVLTFELAAGRVVAPYIGTTIYTWTSVIGVILGALAVGYGLGGYLADKRQKAEDVILLLIAAAAVIFFTNLIKDWLLYRVGGNSLALQWQALLASLVLFAPATVLLGAVSPYLARLSLTGLQTSGRHIARINAAGTVGALVGTFLTGYLLFGFVGTRNILSFLVIVLTASSFLLPSKSFIAGRGLLLLAGLLALASAPKPHIGGLVKDIDTSYSRAIVLDSQLYGRAVRVLSTDNLGWQSGIYLDGDDSLAFPYLRGFYYAAQLGPKTANYLTIGGGAFTFPAYLANNRPGSQVDVAEIDNKLPAISRTYFKFRPRPNLQIVAADGRQFLNRNSKTYNLIFVDAFNALTPPFQLFTREAALRMEASLTDDGVVAVNVISAAVGPHTGMVKAVTRTFGQVFGYVAIFQIQPGRNLASEQNLLMLASQKSLDSRRLAAIQAINPESEAIFSHPVAVKFSSGQLLTDDFAPVERLTGSQL